MFKANLGDRLPGPKKDGSLIKFSVGELQASEWIETVITEPSVKYLVTVDKNRTCFQVKGTRENFFIKAIKEQFQQPGKVELSASMLDTMRELIKSRLPMRISDKIDFVAEHEALTLIRDSVFEQTHVNGAVKVVDDFRDFIKLSSEDGTFMVGFAETHDFLTSINAKYSAIGKEIEPSIFGAIKEIIKKPLRTVPLQSIDSEQELQAIKILSDITNTDLGLSRIPIRKEYQDFVNVSTNNPKCFTIRKGVEDKLFGILKRKYHEEFTYRMDPKNVDIHKRVLKYPLPIQSAITSKFAVDLAATSVAATYVYDSSTNRKIVIYTEAYVNIKSENYFGKEGKKFKNLIDVVKNDGPNQPGMYTIKPNKVNHFIDTIRSEYELVGLSMHPSIEEAIRNVVREPMPEKAGIPGLHAEVLAVNEAQHLITKKLLEVTNDFVLSAATKIIKEFKNHFNAFSEKMKDFMFDVSHTESGFITYQVKSDQKQHFVNYMERLCKDSAVYTPTKFQRDILEKITEISFSIPIERGEKKLNSKEAAVRFFESTNGIIQNVHDEFSQLWNREANFEINVYTHKFGHNQIMDRLLEPGIDKAERFPACHNCSGILKQFCNVFIRTG